MLEEILKNTQRAKEILAVIRSLPADSEMDVQKRGSESGKEDEARSHLNDLEKNETGRRVEICKMLKKAICLKLMIPEDETDDILKLSILSVKRQSGIGASVSDSAVKRQVEKYDCHQTSLVAQKKVLLLMFLEKELGIHLTDDEAASVRTVQDFADMYFHYRSGQ